MYKFVLTSSVIVHNTQWVLLNCIDLRLLPGTHGVIQLADIHDNMVDIYLYNRDQLPVPRWVPLFPVGIRVISTQIFLEDPLRPFGWLRCGSDWDQQPSSQGQHREEPQEGSGRSSTTSYIQCRSRKQIFWAISAADGSDKSKIGCWEILSIQCTVAPPQAVSEDMVVCPPLASHSLITGLSDPEDIKKGYMWACR